MHAVLGQRRVCVLAVVGVDGEGQQLLDRARPPALGHRELRVEVPRFIVALLVLHVDDELFGRHWVAALACSACLAKSWGANAVAANFWSALWPAMRSWRLPSTLLYVPWKTIECLVASVYMPLAARQLAFLPFCKRQRALSVLARLFVIALTAAQSRQYRKKRVNRPRRGATVSSRTAPRVRHRRDRAGRTMLRLLVALTTAAAAFTPLHLTRSTSLNAGKGFGEDPSKVASASRCRSQ